MPEAIESKSFRAAARRNCISYLGIPIYMKTVPELQRLALPTFRTQSPDGAVSQLFSTLVNMNTQIEQIRKGLRMAESKPVPGVSYNEIDNISMRLNGDVYFEDAAQYNAFVQLIATISKEYGWRESVSTAMGAAVYHPAKNAFTNNNPVQSAIKGMVLGTASDVMDAGTLLSASDSIEKGSPEERKYFEARDRYNGGSIFNTAAIQYYSNTPLAVQNHWAGMGDEMTPTLLVEGRPVFKANIPYMPSSVSITPGAFVADGTGMYPTKCEIAIQLANPLGGLFANFSVVKEGEEGPGESGALVPSNYLPDHPKY